MGAIGTNPYKAVQAAALLASLPDASTGMLGFPAPGCRDLASSSPAPTMSQKETEQTPTDPSEAQGAPAQPRSQPSPTDGSLESKAVNLPRSHDLGMGMSQRPRTAREAQEEAGGRRRERAAGLRGERGCWIELSWHQVIFSLTVTRQKGGTAAPGRRRAGSGKMPVAVNPAPMAWERVAVLLLLVSRHPVPSSGPHGVKG